jgi:histone-lysine N-methyltransferase SETD3
MVMEYSMGVPMPVDEHSGLRDGILRECGLHPPLVALASPDAAMRLLACARVASLDDREVYFGPAAAGWSSWAMTPPVFGERERVAISPRNETAACALVLELLNEAGDAAAAVLQGARALCDTALAAPADENEGTICGAPPDDAGVGDAMIAWTQRGGAADASTPHGGISSNDGDGGMSVSIVPARFPNTGRGAAAAAHLPAGHDVVRVPSGTLWTVQAALADPGQRGETYRTFAALGEDTIAALWLVFEKFGEGATSKWAPLLNALPSVPGLTPASWPVAATAALLGGTPVCGDAHAAREKLARQYAALFPALSEHYPEVFPANLYTCVCVSLQSRLHVCPYSSCEGTSYLCPDCSDRLR